MLIGDQSKLSSILRCAGQSLRLATVLSLTQFIGEGFYKPHFLRHHQVSGQARHGPRKGHPLSRPIINFVSDPLGRLATHGTAFEFQKEFSS